MKPLPPVRRTVGVGAGSVMVTGAFAREGGFSLAEMSRNGLEKVGG